MARKPARSGLVSPARQTAKDAARDAGSPKPTPKAAPAQRAGASSPRHLAVYPGSFDPITFGHLDVIARGRTLFDELVVAVGRNPGKDQLFTSDERVRMAQRLVAEMLAAHPAGAPVRVLPYDGLTVDFARELGATCILRGVRNLSDLQYEVQQAVTNREVAHLETAFVVAGQSFAYTSSSLIKQIAAMGDDLSALEPMVPGPVIEALAAKKKARHPALERLRTGMQG